MTFSAFLERASTEHQEMLRKIFQTLPGDTPIKEFKLAPGELCMRQGDTNWDICVLVSGIVDVYTRQADYSVYTLRDFHPPALFGHYEALANVGAIVADVKARTECRFFVLSTSAYLHWVQSDITILMDQMRTSLHTLLLQGSRDRDNLMLSGDVRMAIFLSRYCKERGNEGGNVTVQMTHSEIGEATDLSLRSIARIIASFRARGLLSVRRGKIILNPAQIALIRDLTEL